MSKRLQVLLPHKAGLRMLCHVFWSQVEYKIVCFIIIATDNPYTNEELFTADVRQPWTNYVNNENEYLIIGAAVRSEYPTI